MWFKKPFKIILGYFRPRKYNSRVPLPKLYDIFFRHNLSTRLHRKGEGSLLLSEFECPRTISIKQQQQHHIFLYKKNEKTNYPRHGTLDPRHGTLDPRQKDRLKQKGAKD